MKKKKLHIDFTKRNIVRFVFFCIVALFAVGSLIWIAILIFTRTWRPTNRFLILCQLLSDFIDFLILKAMINNSHNDDDEDFEEE